MRSMESIGGLTHMCDGVMLKKRVHRFSKPRLCDSSGSPRPGFRGHEMLKKLVNTLSKLSPDSEPCTPLDYDFSSILETPVLMTFEMINLSRLHHKKFWISSKKKHASLKISKHRPCDSNGFSRGRGLRILSKWELGG